MGFLIPIGLGLLIFLVAKAVTTGEDNQPQTKTGLSMELEEEISREVEVEIGRRSISTANLACPIKGVSNEAWTKFVLGFAKCYPIDNVSPTNLLGAFAYPYQVLVEMGYCENLQKVREGVYTADWKEPYSEKEFLESAILQYEAYCKWIEWLSAFVKAKIPSSIGMEVLDTKATFSGILAAGQKAGPGGLLKWVSGDRKESTNKAFLKGNGYF